MYPLFAAGSADTSASVSPDSTVSSAGGKENGAIDGPEQAPCQTRPLVMRVGGGYSVLPVPVATPRQATMIAPEQAAEAHAAAPPQPRGSGEASDDPERQQAPVSGAGDRRQAEGDMPRGAEPGRQGGPSAHAEGAVLAKARGCRAAGEGAKSGASEAGSTGPTADNAGQDDDAPHSNQATAAAQVQSHLLKERLCKLWLRETDGFACAFGQSTNYM